MKFEHVRFYVDPDTGELHIFNHGVDEVEVLELLSKPLELTSGRNRSIVALGQTRAGRYLKVIYSPDHEGGGIFVITAFDLPLKQIDALRRRLRRRRP